MFNRKAVRKALDKKMLPYAIIEGNIHLLRRGEDGNFSHCIRFIFNRKGQFVNVDCVTLPEVFGADGNE